MGEIFGLDGGIIEVFIKGIGYLYYQHFMVDLLPSDCDDWCFYYRSILYDGEGCQKRDWKHYIKNFSGFTG